MRLIFVRHGEPDYANDCLTSKGKEQAIKTAERLKNENIKAIYSSPMGRAIETASFTAKDHGLEIQELDFMHEIWWGDKNKDKDGVSNIPLDGHPWSIAYNVLTESDDYVAGDKWKEHPYFKNNLCMDYFDKIKKGTDDLLKKYGLVREGSFYRCEEECDDTIALFAHGGSGAILFSHLLAIPFPIVLTTLPYGLCSVSVFEFSALKGEMTIPRLDIFNDMKHHDNHCLKYEM